MTNQRIPRGMSSSSCIILLAVLGIFMPLRSASPEPYAWPGESWSTAIDLTYLNPSEWAGNLSGAFWNPQSRSLWLADNSGYFTELKEDGLGGFVMERDYSPSGKPDLEGITQADLGADRIYLMCERENYIREFAISTGAETKYWNLTPTVGNLGNDGTEGIAYIPNSWLAASGFRDGVGNLYPESVHGAQGLGGIMLVAVQDTGGAHKGYIYPA